MTWFQLWINLSVCRTDAEICHTDLWTSENAVSGELAWKKNFSKATWFIHYQTISDHDSFPIATENTKLFLIFSGGIEEKFKPEMS